MNKSLGLSRCSTFINTSGAVSEQNVANTKSCPVSSASVRVGRLVRDGVSRHQWKCIATRKSTSVGNQMLGARVGRWGAHLGLGLELGWIASNGSRWSAGTWLDNKASVDADISVANAYELWNDREKIPRWMKWIDSVTVSKQKLDFSKWTLRYRAFGRDFEFSWLARNLEPVQNEMIHWRSVDGLPNKGAVRFYPQGANACRLELTISFELPDVMAPLGTAVGPIVQGVLKNDLNRFKEFSENPSSLLTCRVWQTVVTFTDNR